MARSGSWRRDIFEGMLLEPEVASRPGAPLSTRAGRRAHNGENA